jgi:hypothetical protein
MILVKRRVVEELRDLYAGQMAWIVGKGPSLKHLRAEHFGKGPVLTMNESILIVQGLGLTNPIYSMQKDGCRMSKQAHACPGECQVQPPMTTPNPDITVILQDPGFSEMCLPDHPLRLHVDPVAELGFAEATEMSVLMCIAIAKLMGCTVINFVSCDSLTGDMRTIDVHTLKAEFNVFVGHYAHAVPQVLEAVQEIPHEIITPGAQ